MINILRSVAQGSCDTLVDTSNCLGWFVIGFWSGACALLRASASLAFALRARGCLKGSVWMSLSTDPNGGIRRGQGGSEGNELATPFWGSRGFLRAAAVAGAEEWTTSDGSRGLGCVASPEAEKIRTPPITNVTITLSIPLTPLHPHPRHQETSRSISLDVETLR